MGKALPDDIGSVERTAPIHQARPTDQADAPVAADRGERLRRVPLGRIEANPDQPRKHFDPASLDALAESIASQGLLQPMVVRRRGRRLELVAGERRYRALANLHRTGRLESDRVPVLIREGGVSDEEALVVAFVENHQRDPMRYIEDAEALGRIEQARMERIGRRPTIRELVDLLPPERTVIHGLRTIYEALQDPAIAPLVRGADKLPKAVLLRVLKLKDPEAKAAILRSAADGADADEVRRLVRETRRSRKPDRRLEPVQRTARDDGFDLVVRWRVDMDRSEAEQILERLEEARGELTEWLSQSRP